MAFAGHEACNNQQLRLVALGLGSKIAGYKRSTINSVNADRK